MLLLCGVTVNALIHFNVILCCIRVCPIKSNLILKVPWTIVYASSSMPRSENQPLMKRFKLLSEDTMNRSRAATATGKSNNDNEISNYINYVTGSNCLQGQGSSGAILFWIQNQSSYPLLAPLAQDLVSAPASQAYVERVFSVCGELTYGKRNRLTKGLEKRVFLKINQKFYDL